MDTSESVIISPTDNISQSTDPQVTQVQDNQHQPQQSTETREGPHIVKDGKDAWLTLFAGYLIQVVFLGYLHVFGLFYVAFLQEFKTTKAETAWVGSVAYGLSMGFGPMACSIINRYGKRLAAITGSIICFSALLSSSFATNIGTLFFTFSFLYGVGNSLTFATTMCIAADHFDKYVALATGLLVSGSSMGTLILSPVVAEVLKAIGWRHTFRGMAGFILIGLWSGYLYKPINAIKKTPVQRIRNSLARRIIQDFKLWKNRVFIIWVLAISMVQFGHYIPYVHLVAHAEIIGIPPEKGSLLMTILGGSSVVGRIVFGKIVAHGLLDRLHTHQFSMLIAGASSMVLPLIPSFEGLITYVVCVGLVDGCYVVLIPILNATLAGADSAVLAWGFLSGFSSIFFTVGPPLAGWLYDMNGSYNLPFHVAGSMILGGCGLLFFIPWAQRTGRSTNIMSAAKSRHHMSEMWDMSYSVEYFADGSSANQKYERMERSLPTPVKDIVRPTALSDKFTQTPDCVDAFGLIDAPEDSRVILNPQEFDLIHRHIIPTTITQQESHSESVQDRARNLLHSLRQKSQTPISKYDIPAAIESSFQNRLFLSKTSPVTVPELPTGSPQGQIDTKPCSPSPDMTSFIFPRISSTSLDDHKEHQGPQDDRTQVVMPACDPVASLVSMTNLANPESSVQELTSSPIPSCLAFGRHSSTLASNQLSLDIRQSLVAANNDTKAWSSVDAGNKLMKWNSSTAEENTLTEWHKTTAYNKHKPNWTGSAISAHETTDWDNTTTTSQQAEWKGTAVSAILDDNLEKPIAVSKGQKDWFVVTTAVTKEKEWSKSKELVNQHSEWSSSMASGSQQTEFSNSTAAANHRAEWNNSTTAANQQTEWSSSLAATNQQTEWGSSTAAVNQQPENSNSIASTNQLTKWSSSIALVDQQTDWRNSMAPANKETELNCSMGPGKPNTGWNIPLTPTDQQINMSSMGQTSQETEWRSFVAPVNQQTKQSRSTSNTHQQTETSNSLVTSHQDSEWSDSMAPSNQGNGHSNVLVPMNNHEWNSPLDPNDQQVNSSMTVVNQKAESSCALGHINEKNPPPDWADSLTLTNQTPNWNNAVITYSDHDAQWPGHIPPACQHSNQNDTSQANSFQSFYMSPDENQANVIVDSFIPQVITDMTSPSVLEHESSQESELDAGFQIVRNDFSTNGTPLNEREGIFTMSDLAIDATAQSESAQPSDEPDQ